MTVQITIVGLGQIGASIGLALAEQDDVLECIGHDREIQTARYAEKQGAVRRVEVNLPKAVRDADLIVLALPVDQIRETMEVIAPVLKEDCVVVDTGPIKEIVETWAAELLPPGRHYVGMTPVLNPAYLHTADFGIVAARADLFHGGLMAIVAPARTESGAIKLVSDLTRLVGATAFFADPVEMDGLMAATHHLPQLMAAALVNATVDQPGWREARKVAGKAYAEATGPLVHLDDTQALHASVMMNRDNIVRVLDGTIAALQAIRGDIDSKDGDALGERLLRARRSRLKWWAERDAGEWLSGGQSAVSLPENPGILGRLFGVNRKSKSKS
ncbi:prephenate dehydrogenase [Chloroflexota bacterium]